MNPFSPSYIEKKKEVKVVVARWVLLGMSLALVIPMLWILWLIFSKGYSAVTWEFLTENTRKSGASGGIWGPLVGTFCLTFVCLLIVAPIGILAGIYLNEYAPDNKVTRAIMVAVTSLAGVPSIVHGLFGIGAFVATFHMHKGMLVAAMTLAVMTLPVLITSTREALASVPRNFREACWNLGASRWQTIRTIVLPNSIAGILTGIILVVSRAAGETAPIMLTGAVGYVKLTGDTGVDRYLPFGLNDPFMAMAMHLNTISRDIPNVAENMKFGSALVLLALVLIVNSVATGLRVYLRNRKRW
ncbi:MAG TPA: phosphate ABC transporter permease PstA [Verrucomicrobiales bacterium]|jgi:phosphate transport system permease protein|nr:phosphate ABC transporter permease PstA [Verrucomicrobiales bacterium]